MVAHNAINSLNFSESDLSEELQPLDFTMSKFKSSSPNKHPLYYQFYGSNSDTSSNRDVKKEEQGRWQKLEHPFESDTHSTKRSPQLRDF